MKKQSIPAARFKAECLKLIDRVSNTQESLIVTKRGRPVVEVTPIKAAWTKPLRESVTVRGDIVSPILGFWDVER